MVGDVDDDFASYTRWYELIIKSLIHSVSIRGVWFKVDSMLTADSDSDDEVNLELGVVELVLVEFCS